MSVVGARRVVAVAPDTHTVVGSPAEVREYREHFLQVSDAEELVIAHPSGSLQERLRSVQLLVEAMASVTS